MKKHKAKRLEIIIETPMQSRLTNALIEAGVTGYTLLPVLGGNGRSGPWSREGEVSRAGGLIMVLCIVREEKLDELLELAYAIVDRYIGMVTVTDCDVLRAERF
ncbi:MAG: nitrogen regulatory protein PII [Granulosicoccus sp.]|jgi:nitrogen regulatory protein PII